MNYSKFLQVKSQQFSQLAFSFIGFFSLEAKGKKSWVESWLSLLIRIWERTEMAEADFLSSMQQNWASKCRKLCPFTNLGLCDQIVKCIFASIVYKNAYFLICTIIKKSVFTEILLLFGHFRSKMWTSGHSL